MLLSMMPRSGLSFKFPYKHLENENEAADEKLFDAQDVPKRKRLMDSGLIYWMMTGLLAAALLWLVYEKYHNSNMEKLWGTYEKGFVTELGSTTLGHVRFHSTLWVDEDDIWHMTMNSSESQYVGPPSPEVDRAWSGLLDPRFLYLEPEKANDFGIRFTERDLRQGKIWVEPSGLHDLHCLNYLREALDLEYYTHVKSALRAPEVAGEASHRMHLDHCIELLRQSLMCHLDLTPIPRLWLQNSNLQHANQDQVHICRDFNSIRNWVIENSIVPEN